MRIMRVELEIINFSDFFEILLSSFQVASLYVFSLNPSNGILNCSTFRFKNVDMFLPDRIIETAKLFIFCGSISPSNENRTGPIPKP